MLDFSKLETGKMDLSEEDFDLRNLLDAILMPLSTLAESKGGELSWSVDPLIPRTLCGDPLRLQQALTNLVDNAVKFTEGGEVRVAVTLECQNAAETASEEAPMPLRFSIADTGIGIAPENLETIFERFAQADGTLTRKYGGTGLGLTISKSIIDLMKGRIWVNSEVGKGSTFQFTIELGRGQSQGGDCFVEPEPEGDSRTKKMRILVAEDENINRKMVLLMLEKQGHYVRSVGTGVAAIKALEEQPFDLVLMDLQMPEMDGIEATRRIRACSDNRIDPQIPIIALTAHATQAFKDRCLDAGMTDFISKPIDLKRLVKIVRRCENSEPEAKPSILTRIPVRGDIVDIQKVLDRLDGDEETMLVGWRAFEDEVPSKLQLLKKALESGAPSIVERLAHSLKGAAANIGAERLKAEAFRMELAARKETLEKARTLVAGLEREVSAVLGFLKNRSISYRDLEGEDS